jgi:hypothetical protein
VPTQLDHDLLPRLVLDGHQRLLDSRAGGLELILGQPGAQDHVGIQPQRLRKIFGQRRAGEGEVDCAHALAVLHAEVIERGGELLAVAITCSARDQFAEDRG